ncbi:MAG: hypothetical protein SPF35_06480 [Prevotella sp.]|uniref:hypothetical protein n=1 Tax=uncultured Prevotella sp. TaxID=159272 RepID=UPI00259370E4|nr:hypothetical protein [uncultured Prevotella sp.]MCI6897495.1 hypothetical protein [Prevotella sp.]MDY3252847.1 hypothetical protein [Prevotella sp.]MDY5681158.1 hypothetical protein [Prevotella sp.]
MNDKKTYICRPQTVVVRVAVSNMICTSIPSHDKSTDETIKGEESLSKENVNAWNMWDDESK